ncbi:MAG: zinc-ribbon domain-containing protein [Bacilli bacterium]|nr:zinc-ribbon domain-containing protein [Bacilli bacterium]
MNNYCTNCGKQLQKNEKYCSNCGTKLNNIDKKNKLEEQTIQEEKTAKKYGSITIEMFLTTLILFILEKIYKWEYLKIINPLFLIGTCLLFLYTLGRFNNVKSEKIFPNKIINELKFIALCLIIYTVLLLGFLHLFCNMLKDCDG